MLSEFPPRRITPEFVRFALHHRGYVQLWQDGRLVERMEPFRFAGPAPAGCFDPRKVTRPLLTPRGRARQKQLKQPKVLRKSNTVIEASKYRYLRPIIRRILT